VLAHRTCYFHWLDKCFYQICNDVHNMYVPFVHISGNERNAHWHHVVRKWMSWNKLIINALLNFQAQLECLHNFVTIIYATHCFSHGHTTDKPMWVDWFVSDNNSVAAIVSNFNDFNYFIHTVLCQWEQKQTRQFKNFDTNFERKSHVEKLWIAYQFDG
jgi:hypothetical protein